MAEATACSLCGRSPARRGRGRGRRPYCGRCEAKAGREIARPRRVDCGVCGRKFSARRISAKYCSDPCRAEAVRRQNRECARRYMSDPEKYAIALARSRAWAAGKSAAGRGGGSRPRAGRVAGSRPRTSPARSAACRLCGRSFAQYGGATNHAYCRRCTAKADREATRVLRVDCKACGEKFSTPNRSVRYCSDPCRAEGQRRNRRENDRRRRSDPDRHARAAAYAGARDGARDGGEEDRPGRRRT